tara:strand:- start:112 stop:315 length:204 start_codon:yes stop_codon:yes gene_type:complete
MELPINTVVNISINDIIRTLFDESDDDIFNFIIELNDGVACYEFTKRLANYFQMSVARVEAENKNHV